MPPAAYFLPAAAKSTPPEAAHADSAANPRQKKHPRHPLHNLPAIIPPRAPTLRAWEVNGMDDFWELFCQTGAPEAYMLYRAAQEENACSKQKP